MMMMMRSVYFVVVSIPDLSIVQIVSSKYLIHIIIEMNSYRSDVLSVV